MTKSELVKYYAEATGLSQAKADEYLNRLGDIMAAELLGGGEISLPNVGKLVVIDTKARKGRNPRTGETINIPAGKRVSFRITKALKESFK